MKDLNAIKAANAAENVGDKLGQWNGNSLILKAIHAKTFWSVRADMQRSRPAWATPNVAEGWEHPEYRDYEAFRDRLLADAADSVEPHFSPVLEKNVL